MTDKAGDGGAELAELEIIDHHFHSPEHWFGLAAVPSGETHRADEMNGTIQPFVATTGNSDFGSWVQVLGSSDTPFVTGKKYFDPHRFSIAAASSANQYVAQIATGESAGLAAKVAAKEYTSVPYKSILANINFAVQAIQSDRTPAGEKIWVRVACVGANAQTMSFYFGIHEYEK